MKFAALLLMLASLLGMRQESAVSSLDQAAPSPVRFAAVDVFIDPHGKPLAVYQIEVTAVAGDVTLVGIEGGEAPFDAAPYYDTHALSHGNRIILGAYSLEGHLPTTRTRVATLMIRAAGTVTPAYQVRAQAIASTDAKEIAADATATARAPRGANAASAISLSR